MMKLLKKLYEELWVPVLGRILMLFSAVIEGREIKDWKDQTFDLRDKKEKLR